MEEIFYCKFLNFETFNYGLYIRGIDIGIIESVSFRF